MAIFYRHETTASLKFYLCRVQIFLSSVISGTSRLNTQIRGRISAKFSFPI
ncbi:hypothetical protein HZ326_24941, partial [Fusarium oxysporum f. sp. albedinis]